MSFFKTANAPLLGVYQSSGKFSKCAAKHADISTEEDKAIKYALNLISPSVLKAVAKVYDLSDNINDYIFPVPRAVKADEPNSNGDNFSHDELTRFSSRHKCQVYKTFVNVPLHIEHASDNPKGARGFIPDSYYVQTDPNDRYVLTLVAMDTTKDAPLADGLVSGDINTFSMGCICDSVQCSYSKCGKVAKSDRDLCDHLRWYKMSTLEGELIYENCIGVEYQELSVVGDPAYEGAQTQYLLQRAAHLAEINQVKESFSIISSLVDTNDQYEISRFVSANVNSLPEPVLRLFKKIL